MLPPPLPSIISASQQSSDNYVQLLVNEEPREIGVCRSSDSGEHGEWEHSHSLCKLEVLIKATEGLSPLTELCKRTQDDNSLAN